MVREKLNTRAAGIVALAVMLSRVLGLARELIFAALFGAGRGMDAYITAYRAPNLLRDLFAEGALSVAFVTVFSSSGWKKAMRLRGNWRGRWPPWSSFSCPWSLCSGSFSPRR